MPTPDELWRKWKEEQQIEPVITKQELQRIYEALKRYAQKIGIDPDTYAQENLDLIDPLISFNENVENLRKQGVNLILSGEEERAINQEIETRKQQLIKELSELDPKFRELWKQFTDYQIENVALKRKFRELSDELKKLKSEIEKRQVEVQVRGISGRISRNEEAIRELKKKLEERIEAPAERLKPFLDSVSSAIIARKLPLSKGWLGYTEFAKKFYNVIKPFDSSKYIPYFVELWAQMIKDPSRAYNTFTTGMNLLLSKLQTKEITRVEAAKFVENWIKEHNIGFPINISRFLDENWNRLEPILKKGDVESLLNEIDKLLPSYIIKEKPREEGRVERAVGPVVISRRELRSALVSALNEILGVTITRPIEPITPRGTRVARMIYEEDYPPFITHPIAVDEEGYPAIDNLDFLRQLYKNILGRDIWKDLLKNPPPKEEVRRVASELLERVASPSVRKWISKLLELMRE